MIWACLHLAVVVLSFGLSVKALEPDYFQSNRHFSLSSISAGDKADENSARTALVRQSLAEAAGVYNSKEKAQGPGVSNTVFITVVPFSEAPFYKAYFYNLLCFAQHYGINVVAYVIHHNTSAWAADTKPLSQSGVKVLSYPDRLLQALVSSKTSDLQSSAGGKIGIKRTLPQLSTHGVLVKLVPILEVLLHGYNCIFIEPDVALILDPVPFLVHSQSDFVSGATISTCPDAYTSAMVNASNGARASTVPETGTMFLRSSEASIGLFTRWLLATAKDFQAKRLILKDFPLVEHAFDCLGQGPTPTQKQGSASPRTVITKRWSGNYSALVNDVTHGQYQQQARYCFLSELLFQNDYVAFACGGKVAVKDSWVADMYWHGLTRHDAAAISSNATMQYHNRSEKSAARFAVAIHTGFEPGAPNKKAHELKARGLWLWPHDRNVYAPFSSAACTVYDPYQTMYATRDRKTEIEQIIKKRAYLYNTFVQLGKVIQDKNGLMYLVDDQRRKQLIPDLETFVAHMGKDKLKLVRRLPDPVMDCVPSGMPLPSLKNDAIAAQVATLLPANTSTSIIRSVPASNATENGTKVVTEAVQRISAGMLLRNEESGQVYYIDRNKRKRSVRSVDNFIKLFGKEAKQLVLVTVSDKVLKGISEGEPLPYRRR